MSLLDTYLQWINKLSVDIRLQLIARISESIRKENKDREARFYASFGQLETEQTADELIEEIRSTRYFRDKSFDL